MVLEAEKCMHLKVYLLTFFDENLEPVIYRRKKKHLAEILKTPPKVQQLETDRSKQPQKRPRNF